MDAWQFPKYPGKTVILPPEIDQPVELIKFISLNVVLLMEPDCWLGPWINPQTRHFYFDITTSCDGSEEARRAALDISARQGRKIVAVYNSKLNEIVYL